MVENVELLDVAAFNKVLAGYRVLDLEAVESARELTTGEQQASAAVEHDPYACC